MTATPSLHWHLWGKADPKRAEIGPAWHPLACHIIDVAACAEQLLESVRVSRLDFAARALGLGKEQARRWLAFFVALHDLGKATPAFQRKVPEAEQRLLRLGFDFPGSEEPHGGMSAVLVDGALAELGVPPPLARLVARAVGAHHGDFAELGHLNDIRDVRRHLGKARAWQQARAELVRDLAGVLEIQGAGTPTLPASASAMHAFAVDLAGLTTASDWLGSDADRFRYAEPPGALSGYLEQARRLAAEACLAVGFRAPPRPAPRGFVELFNKSPWPLHEVVAEVLSDVEPGSLVIVEAPMGEGKTEAALLLYDTLASRGADGLYFALPTQATANQILGRVGAFLASSFEGRQGLHLVHGGAGLSDRYEDLKRRAFRAQSIGGAATAQDEAPIADAWFTRSKRALLAPFGVGTVDQALLAVLRAKHHFLRLHGLAGKVFVVDEVHAYDTFTSEILARLCAWLRSLDATVVLLSATLSSPQRERLLSVYDSAPSVGAASYPRVTVATNAATVTRSFAARRPPLEVRLVWEPSERALETVREALREGGCAVWIVNTVARAQELFARLRAEQQAGTFSVDVDLHLLHARLPLAERLRRERAAEAAFGPAGPSTVRPHAALVIGTQVLEQSLDLDFDLMVTELAPADLVLQRAGRLHRHDRAIRPPRVRDRVLIVERPEGEDAPEGPNFGKSAFVYDEEILLRSHRALRGRSAVTLPGDIEPLVEEVYASDALPEGGAPAFVARITAARAQRQAKDSGEAYAAELKLLPEPNASDPFRSFACRFDEEDPAVHEMLRATTRLGEPSLTLVPVHETSGGLRLAGDPSCVFDPEAAGLDRGLAIAIARQALTVSHRGLVRALLREHPRAFERTGLLRHHRLLRLDERSCAVVGNTPIRFDRQLGLLLGDLVNLPA
jgi:CRISPR-associated endonuclease/helicase Cas3